MASLPSNNSKIIKRKVNVKKHKKISTKKSKPSLALSSDKIKKVDPMYYRYPITLSSNFKSFRNLPSIVEDSRY